MKKLFMAAAVLTIAVATAPNFVSQSQAAPDRGPGSEFCNLAKAQRNAPSWNEYYGCMKAPAKQAFAHAPAPARASATRPERGPGSQYCDLAKAQRNAPSWNEYYGCMRR
jgi:hypothetical protein